MNRREKEGNIKTVIWKKFDWRIASWSEIVAKKWARDISYFLLPNIPIQNKIIKIVVFLWCLLVFFVIWHLLQLSQGQTSSEHFSPKPCRYVFWFVACIISRQSNINLPIGDFPFTAGWKQQQARYVSGGKILSQYTITIDWLIVRLRPVASGVEISKVFAFQ